MDRTAQILQYTKYTSIYSERAAGGMKHRGPTGHRREEIVAGGN